LKVNTFRCKREFVDESWLVLHVSPVLVLGGAWLGQAIHPSGHVPIRFACLAFDDFTIGLKVSDDDDGDAHGVHRDHGVLCDNGRVCGCLARLILTAKAGLE
jgi:hypothetical protein